MRTKPIRRPPSDAVPEADVRRVLGQALAAVAAGQTERALALLGPDSLEAVDRVPGVAGVDAALAVASVFHRARRLDRAERYYLRALDGGPNVSACINLGHICHFVGRVAEAIEWRRKAVALCPGDASLAADLATSLIFVGRKDEGMELLRAAAVAAGDRSIHSMVLMNLHYQASLDVQALFEEHRRWAKVHAPTHLARSSHANSRDPDRRLRVGYLSPDFRTHPVAYFFESLLEGHDRAAVEVFGYGQVACPDETTWRLQARFDAYQNVCGLDDRALVTMIENDRIDVLVDLAGHTGGNRLGVLACKPAPVQVTYLGYPDTTGMEQVDYRLTDELSTPAELQPFYTEELMYLPEGFLCYRPPDWAPQVLPLPAADKGYVTFGSFNDTCKVNGPLLAMWARILSAHPGSRLLFKSRAGADPQVRRIFLDQFQLAGISPDRVIMEGQKPAIEYLRLHNQVDIALDTFPYNGTTTTCDALWMGVPVVSLVGRHHASRVGLSILSRVGLETLAAGSPDDYVAKATALAENQRALEKIRASMRRRMMASPLCNGKAFARAVESAYRRMWQRWCRAGGENG
jgi:protein O-GlcNAc transferase